MSDEEPGMDLIPFARASNELLLKLLGPSADYVGDSWRAKLEKRAQANADRIATLAIEKLGDRIKLEGSVPPRVLKGILDEAPFCDDEVAAEYVSGVLASSRTPDGQDDRGATIISTIGRLSALSLRAHYVFYEVIRSLYRSRDVALISKEGYRSAATYIPISVYQAGLGGASLDHLKLQHVLYHLTREDLLSWERFGNAEFLAEESNQYMTNGVAVEYPGAGIILAPTKLGVDLYMWSMGQGGIDPDIFFDSEFEGFQIPGVAIETGAQTIGSILTKASRANLLIQ